MKIRYRDGYKYQLVEDYFCQTNIKPVVVIDHDFIKLLPDGMLTVRAGYAWDGPSGPTIDTKNFMRGSLVHDSLYQLMRGKFLDCGWRETADQELRRICNEDGMSWLRAWWVYQGVRFGGEGSAKWQEEKILTAP
jgi:hypothetical protein